MVRKVLLSVILIMFISLPLLARDIIATFQYSNWQTITITTRDSKHVRMDNAPDSYMLMNDKKIYTVTKDEDGQWNVMDMDQMKGMSGMMGNLFNKKGKTPEYDVDIKDTGKEEKIAGYTGKVYIATFLEDGKAVDTKEMVFCNKDEIQQVNDAWVAIASNMGQMMAGNEIAKLVEQSNNSARKNKYGGMIRMGNEMKLQNVTQKSLDDSYYEIPSGAETIEMGNQMDQIQEKQAETQSDDADDTAEKAQDEPKEGKMDGVKKGMKGLLKGIFKK